MAKYEKTFRPLTLSTNIMFGKYKGLSLYNILMRDKSYFVWLCNIWEGVIHVKVLDISYEIQTGKSRVVLKKDK